MKISKYGIGKYRKRRKLARLALLVIFGAGSIIAYALLAFTINGQPPLQPFPGWVAVLQPVTETVTDKVNLYVASDVSDRYPELDYQLVVCGPASSYHGDLLLGGAAMVVNAMIITSGKVHYLKDFTPMFDGAPVPLGPAERIPFKLNNVPPCPTSPPGTVAGGIFGGAVASYVTGRIATPIRRTWSAPFGLWHGPNSVESWPRVGDLDGFYGAATLPGVLPGQWNVPIMQSLHITSITTNVDPFTASVQSASPAVTDSSSAEWSSVTPIVATARLVNAAAINALQQWLVVAGVGLGIGGAMLASLTFEWLRPPGKLMAPHADRRHETRLPRRQTAGWRSVIGVAVLVALVVRLTRSALRNSK